MRVIALVFSLLVVGAFSLTAWLEPWFQSWIGSRTQSANVLTVALGDSRRLLAKHFYVKADAYFHSGYYPSIYDSQPDTDKMHMAEDAGAGQEKREEEGSDFLGKPKDWIDAFGRHFYPSMHRHLGEDADHNHSSDARAHEEREQNASGDEREILPWLRLAATLDPERPDTYIVASYWMRSRLSKVNEAEQFLREGLRANPGHSEILFELGRIYSENRKDAVRARNVWELALRNWKEKESAESEPNIFLYAQILGNLAKLEEEQKDYAKAIEHLTMLKVVSPNKAPLQKWIDGLKTKQTP